MGKQKARYQAWADARISAWANGDVEAEMDTYAEDPVYIAVDPFGNHRTVQGREALREITERTAANWSNKKIIENTVLSANKERGILHTWVTWSSTDGKDWACSSTVIIHLDKNDKCTEYKEWNVAKVRDDETDLELPNNL